MLCGMPRTFPLGGRWPAGPDEGSVFNQRNPPVTALRRCHPPFTRGAIMGPPPKPSGDSRGFGGESRSSGMRELSPSGGSERYGACDDEGAAPCGRPRADGDIGPYRWCTPCRARPPGRDAPSPWGKAPPEGADEGSVSNQRNPPVTALRRCHPPFTRGAIMGPPPKPSGDSRGFGGESRSSGMSERSPSGGSERYGACDDEGAAPCGRPQTENSRAARRPPLQTKGR